MELAGEDNQPVQPEPPVPAALLPFPQQEDQQPAVGQGPPVPAAPHSASTEQRMQPAEDEPPRGT